MYNKIKGGFTMRKTITLSNEIDIEIKKLAKENKITQNQILEILLREALNSRKRRITLNGSISNNTDKRV